MPAVVPIQTRNGTAAEWTAANPILLKGEQGIETDTNKVKYGDGVTAWTSLAYAGGGGSYTLPTASPTVLGGVKIDNNTIIIDGSGIITANASLHSKVLVKNATGSTIAKGKAVYVNGANGTNVTIALAQANAESTSSQTLGLVEADILTGADGYVLTQGALAGLDTTAAANEGDPVYLSPTVAGGLVYGLINKPSAPSHLVYMGTVSRKNLNNGEIFIKVQNGYELEELHNVKITTPVNNNVLKYDSVTSLWINDVLPLPTASTTVLGGVKIDGTTITISGDVISAVGGGGGASPSDTAPLINGTAAAGTSLLYSRGDHVHPTDTTLAALASPTFTGTPAAPTATANTNTTQLATTAYVVGQAASVAPVMNGTAAVGTSLKYARQDHVHGSDTAKASLASANTFTAQNTFNGSSSVLAVVLPNAAETTTVSATAATGTINIDFSTQSVLYYTTNASANWVVNFRHSSGTSLNTAMAIGQTVTMTFLVTQGATAYYNTSVQVDGTTTGVTTKWQGGTAPTSGNASAIDVYTYAIIKTAAATFTVLAAVSKFA